MPFEPMQMVLCAWKLSSLNAAQSIPFAATHYSICTLDYTLFTHSHTHTNTRKRTKFVERDREREREKWVDHLHFSLPCKLWRILIEVRRQKSISNSIILDRYRYRFIYTRTLFFDLNIGKHNANTNFMCGSIEYPDYLVMNQILPIHLNWFFFHSRRQQQPQQKHLKNRNNSTWDPIYAMKWIKFDCIEIEIEMQVLNRSANIQQYIFHIRWRIFKENIYTLCCYFNTTFCRIAHSIWVCMRYKMSISNEDSSYMNSSINICMYSISICIVHTLQISRSNCINCEEQNVFVFVFVQVDWFSTHHWRERTMVMQRLRSSFMPRIKKTFTECTLKNVLKVDRISWGFIQFTNKKKKEKNNNELDTFVFCAEK